MSLAPRVLVLATTLACAHKPEGPAATLQEFGAALARGDVRGAYALTSADFQKRTPYDAFAAGLGANPADTKALGKRVGEQAARVAPRVDIQLAAGRDASRWCSRRAAGASTGPRLSRGASGRRARRCARSCARWASAATTSCCGWSRAGTASTSPPTSCGNTGRRTRTRRAALLTRLQAALAAPDRRVG